VKTAGDGSTGPCADVPWSSLVALLLQMVSGVHAEAAGAAAEAVALGSVLACVAVLAEEFSLVLGAVSGVQQLVAHSTLEAHLVELESSSHALLGGVDGLAALRALGVLDGLERHLGRFFLVLQCDLKFRVSLVGTLQ